LPDACTGFQPKFSRTFGGLKIILEVEYHRAVSTAQKGAKYCTLCNKDVVDDVEIHLMYGGKYTLDKGKGPFRMLTAKCSLRKDSHVCPNYETDIAPSLTTPYGITVCDGCGESSTSAPTANRQESLCQFELQGVEWKAVNHGESFDLSVRL
jgi:hypothetical protein